MADISKGRKQADAAFRKAQKVGWQDNKSDALRAYEGDAEAARKNAARLKELRLAKEAAERQEHSASGKTGKPAKT